MTAAAAAPAPQRTRIDFDRRPILVFWETTKACLLACRHCRADAIPHALPGELTHAEGLTFVESLLDFGRPPPVLVLTGGDVLMRPDALDLARRATSLRIPVALAPSVTPKLTATSVSDIRAAGVKAVSISLDGADAHTHDVFRGIGGHFAETLAAIRRLREGGLVVQVNTVATRANVEQFADVAAILASLDVNIWEVFFLVRTGRGSTLEEPTRGQCEDVCHFLFDASQYGFVVRTVEAPFFRPIVAARREGGPPSGGALYSLLSTRLRNLLGEPRDRPSAHTKGTRDGKGIVFVGHDGSVSPAGFLPVTLGNVRDRPLAEIYRDSPLLLDIRAGRFEGQCGSCAFTQLCGGSRARAYAATGDPLATDPACPFVA